MRGFGYWVWKPEIIYQQLVSSSHNDIIMYVDVGCHLNSRGRSRLCDYIEMATLSPTGIVAFQTIRPDAANSSIEYDGRRLLDYPIIEWTKADLLDYFGIDDISLLESTQTFGAGILLLRKCSTSVSFVKEWLEVARNSISLIDDTPSKLQNHPSFKEHRHDQSVFSLLCLKYPVTIVSAYEYWYPRHIKAGPLSSADWASLVTFPVHAKRDLDRGPLRNTLNCFRKTATQIRLKVNKLLSTLSSSDST